MNNFWENYGKSYAAFSQHCDNSDWRKILETISNEILNIGVNRPLNILDVGTGIGKNIAEVLEMLLSKTSRMNILDVVEPSQQAVDIMSKFLLKMDEGGFMRNIFRNINDVEMNKYDVIIFMHSSYYIQIFNGVVQSLLKNNLNGNGKIIILSLSSNSPFFLDKPQLNLPNTSDSIKNYLRGKGIQFSDVWLDSRFHFSGNGKADINSFRFFYDFMTQRKIELDEFKVLLKDVGKNGELNFKDELITIAK